MSTLAAILGFAALFAAFGVLGATIGRWNRGGGCAGDGHGCGACHWSERECPERAPGIRTTMAAPGSRRADRPSRPGRPPARRGAPRATRTGPEPSTADHERTYDAGEDHDG